MIFWLVFAPVLTYACYTNYYKLSKTDYTILKYLWMIFWLVLAPVLTYACYTDYYKPSKTDYIRFIICIDEVEYLDFKNAITPHLKKDGTPYTCEEK